MAKAHLTVVQYPTPAQAHGLDSFTVRHGENHCGSVDHCIGARLVRDKSAGIEPLPRCVARGTLCPVEQNEKKGGELHA